MTNTNFFTSRSSNIFK